MWIIGNGESRKDINIDLLKGPKVGCNAILRDYVVDHLICVDRRMFVEAVQKNYNQHSKVYTRKDWFVKTKNTRLVPDIPYGGYEKVDDPFHWGSGPYAVLLAATLTKDPIKLIGFDLYGIENKVNNIYKDSQHYDSSNKKSVDPRFWIYQIGKVFECFTKNKFIVYADDDWQCPKLWKKSNVTIDKISNIHYNV